MYDDPYEDPDEPACASDMLPASMLYEDPYDDPDELAGVRDMLPVNTLARTFGRNVSLLRCAQHLTKRLLADMAGISRPYLNDIEGGVADVRLSTLMRVADALAVSPLVLLCDLCPREYRNTYPGS